MMQEQVHVGPGRLPGELAVPERAAGLVLFAHGSGSSRLSPRNVFVAQQLQARGLGTLLFDLLTEGEARNRVNVFQIELLGQRLVEAIAWVRERGDIGAMRIGLFGASTGAAGALLAAAQRPGDVLAVVSRGGRPDLAGAALPRVRAPTLLLVGGADTEVLGLNRQAFEHLACEKRLDIVPGATHLFEEAGTLERVAELAGDWLLQHLQPAG
ncbi:dienelactone hydrolase family protein [Ramlibacter monticola]|uniref:Dienelactone hydrolase family protein n=1 Tax=Ramlibacter monticola TaxID=1926872 RepID=A0A936Z586_9BURK|nr:dienelactone hydrolase family protein [Ramlibacter monticola]MBL0395258.1 dienelactone hydrolase family protein [Ramlibacter monticola]